MGILAFGLALYAEEKQEGSLRWDVMKMDIILQRLLFLSV